MRISIVYDNVSADPSFLSGWGFSCLIGGSILFDAGEAAGPVFHNMDRLNIDIGTVKAAVISHDHRDHTGGLRDVLAKKLFKEAYGIKYLSIAAGCSLDL